jgi:uncharacterized membrane protein
MTETKTRSFVKAIVYRVWVLFSTYVMLLITGQTMETAVVPTIVINVIWTVSYYLYDRLWSHINWGKSK